MGIPAGTAERIFQPFPKWKVFARVSPDFYILCRTDHGKPRFAPLAVHRFRLIEPPNLPEAQRFTRQYHSYEEIGNVPDRLRWCRLQMGLLQREVAERMGVTTPFYIDMETGACEHTPAAVVDRLAELYGVPVTDLLDGYNRFLYEGQARQILALRHRAGLSRAAFARKTGISESSLRAWEMETKTISKKCWERYFREQR